MHDMYLYGDGIFLFLHTNDSFIFVHYFKCQRSNVICFNETTLWEKIQPLNHSRCKKSGVWWSKSKIINCKPNLVIKQKLSTVLLNIFHKSFCFLMRLGVNIPLGFKPLWNFVPRKSWAKLSISSIIIWSKIHKYIQKE